MPESERRFVVLHHRTRDGEHWDLMLETAGVLATWQLAAHPQKLREIGGRIPVRRISDHRLAYLDYEGPLSGDRGEVTRVDSGTYSCVEQHPGHWIVQCTGQILQGHLRIEGLRPGDAGVATHIRQSPGRSSG